MKQYTVVGLNPNDLYDIGGPREARHTYWTHTQYEKDSNPGNYDGKVKLYFCDTEVAANALAAYLATKAPNIYWMASKNLTSYQSAPGPVKKAAFTEQGLLPTT
jgi:hypothetical protein